MRFYILHKPMEGARAPPAPPGYATGLNINKLPITAAVFTIRKQIIANTDIQLIILIITLFTLLTKISLSYIIKMISCVSVLAIICLLLVKSTSFRKLNYSYSNTERKLFSQIQPGFLWLQPCVTRKSVIANSIKTKLSIYFDVGPADTAGRKSVSVRAYF